MCHFFQDFLHPELLALWIQIFGVASTSRWNIGYIYISRTLSLSFHRKKDTPARRPHPFFVFYAHWQNVLPLVFSFIFLVRLTPPAVLGGAMPKYRANFFIVLR